MKRTQPSPRLIVFSMAASLLAAVAAGCWSRSAAPLVAQKPAQVNQLASDGDDYVNPVINQNFPDPSILRVGDSFYAYATNSGPNMLCARSSDLVNWTVLPDAMPTLPVWANAGRTWAPEVRQYGPGKRYVAYFCALSKASNAQAVGVAVSSSPTGPFVSASDAPLISQTDQGGAIDPSCFVASDGSHWLVWKNDGNSRGLPTWLWLQKLDEAGTALVGQRFQLIREDQPWEGNLIEAPTLWQHGSHFYLFYSANAFNTCNYAIGYAISNSLTGPYVKPRTSPWVSATSQVCGPGGEDIVALPDGRTWMAYHSWANGPNSYRSMDIDPLIWDGDVPYLLGPSKWQQPSPYVK